MCVYQLIMAQQERNIDIVINDFQQITEKPVAFLSADDSLLNKIKSGLKSSYDYTKSEEKNVAKSSALQSLIIKNFDLEQIWQQIELQNNSLLPQSIEDVSKLIVGKNQLIFDNLRQEIEKEINESGNEIAHNEGEKDASESDNSESESDNDELQLDEDDDEMSEEETVNDKPNTSKKKSVVDDEFFKLDEMEKFLNAEENKIEKDGAEHESSDSDDESVHSIDLFKEDSNEEDEEDKVKTAKFKDFFVAKEEDKKTKRNKFLEDVSDDDASNPEKEIKSSLELRQERLQRKIKRIEEEAIGEKPWQLKGEIRAEDRPQNSLLEEVVEFDMTSRPAPIITEKTTLQLEDIIIQRIKDKVFDSVQRKIKPVESLLEYKKKLVLDQEKSKKSLAQIYETEFMEQQAALDQNNEDKEEEEPELHTEIRGVMKTLFNKLDALSNFHFTPKPAIPELKIVNNLPAISMEEVAPNATSEAALLAPEEVKNKPKGEIIAKGERTSTDKNRERRKKKQKQRAHLKEKQKRENKLNLGLGNKYSKAKAKEMLEKVTKESNTEKMDEKMGSKTVRSSKAFFTQLQEEVQSQIHSKITVNKNKKKKDHHTAKKIKL